VGTNLLLVNLKPPALISLQTALSKSALPRTWKRIGELTLTLGNTLFSEVLNGAIKKNISYIRFYVNTLQSLAFCYNEQKERGKMYCEFYGFKERPFNITSDPSFFFSSKNHKEALAHLLYGVSQRKGIIVLTGEIGTGKTTVCRFLLNQLGKNIKTAFILNPHTSETQIMESIIRDFGIPFKQNSKPDMLQKLNTFLLKESQAGNNVLLIIDEAQNLTPGILEQLRLLSNLETEKDKLLQVILVGQPELNEKLNLFNLRQLRQRIMVRYHIGMLEAEEVKDYINHRIQIGRPQKNIEFLDQAIKLIVDFSKGTPRLINMLCDRALLAGFVAEKNQINAEIINKCIEEFQNY
jgi:general secretion pathway protein A